MKSKEWQKKKKQEKRQEKETMSMDREGWKSTFGWSQRGPTWWAEVARSPGVLCSWLPHTETHAAALFSRHAETTQSGTVGVGLERRGPDELTLGCVTALKGQRLLATDATRL